MWAAALLVLSAFALAPRASALPAADVVTDGAHEVLAAPPAPLPLLGPRYALVTIDLFLQIGSLQGAQNMALLLRLAREAQAQGQDRALRLIYHPVPVGNSQAERGAEVLREALAQDRFWPLCELLHGKPDLLLPAREPDLLKAAAHLGLAEAPLRDALHTGRHRADVARQWRKDHELCPLPPLLWVNGKPLRGALAQDLLRDEIAQARDRAQAVLSSGVPLSHLYERLLSQDDAPGRRTAAQTGPALLQIAPDPTLPSRVFVDTTGSPARGPRVAPVVLVLFGSFDSYATYAFASLVGQIMLRHPGRLRLVFKHNPSAAAPAALPQAAVLAQLALLSDESFFRACDLLVATLGQRFLTSPMEVADTLRRLPEVATMPAPTAEARRVVARDLLQAQELGLSGPSLVVNGVVLRTVPSLEALDRRVSEELERGVLARLRSR